MQEAHHRVQKITAQGSPGLSCGLDFGAHLKEPGCLGLFNNTLTFTEERFFLPPNEHGIDSTIPRHLDLAVLRVSCRNLCSVGTDVRSGSIFFLFYLFK